ncbi:hypothetical protein Gogos_021870, partial [Gossypium gossypioides]|nr:hypothetical protein [Gossypium gossypioides]
MARNSTWREGFQDCLEEKWSKIAWDFQIKRKDEMTKTFNMKEENEFVTFEMKELVP